MTTSTFILNSLLIFGLAFSFGCASKAKVEVAKLTPAGEAVTIEENWSALVGCKLIKEIRTYALTTDDALVQLRNDAALIGAKSLTDIEWGRGDKDGKRMLIGKAEAYKCHAR